MALPPYKRIFIVIEWCLSPKKTSLPFTNRSLLKTRNLVPGRQCVKIEVTIFFKQIKKQISKSEHMSKIFAPHEVSHEVVSSKKQKTNRIEIERRSNAKISPIGYKVR